VDEKNRNVAHAMLSNPGTASEFGQALIDVDTLSRDWNPLRKIGVQADAQGVNLYEK